MPVRRQVTIGTPRKNQRRNRVPHGGRLASLKRTSSSLSRAGALPGRPMCRFPRRPAAPCARTSGAMSAIRAGRSRLFHGREAHRCKHCSRPDQCRECLLRRRARDEHRHEPRVDHDLCSGWQYGAPDQRGDRGRVGNACARPLHRSR
jgi:hypothetical protein